MRFNFTTLGIFILVLLIVIGIPSTFYLEYNYSKDVRDSNNIEDCFHGLSKYPIYTERDNIESCKEEFEFRTELAALLLEEKDES